MQKMVVVVSVLCSLVMVIFLLGILYGWSKKKRSQVKLPDKPVQTIEKSISWRAKTMIQHYRLLAWLWYPSLLIILQLARSLGKVALVRFTREHENEANTNNVVGTVGYLSPEYALDGIFSEKTDVFSFGVLVLEIVSGEKNRGFSHENDSDNLLAHAWRLFEEGMAAELLGSHM
ncbi:hypothetical protein L1887_10828 [Cichorium endivia]|nr:hypothetical protein L1887_10828 [Cichorium endivia]